MNKKGLTAVVIRTCSEREKGGEGWIIGIVCRSSVYATLRTQTLGDLGTTSPPSTSPTLYSVLISMRLYYRGQIEGCSAFSYVTTLHELLRKWVPPTPPHS